MFTRILFPTDFSGVSDLAAAHIHKLREAGAPDALVLNVIDPSPLMAPAAPGPLGGVGATPAMNERAFEEWRESATEACGRLADEFTEVGFNATAAVEVGDPAKIILRTALAEDSNVIVVGAHGRGHVAEFFLGSVSDEVVRKSHIPVLVIKP